MPWKRAACRAVLAITLLLAATTAGAQSAEPGRPSLTIPALAAAPDFTDFLDMRADGALERSMAQVEAFVQRWPADGRPARQRTVVYLGYTRDALHVVYVAFDDNPDAIRAHLARREEVFAINDDAVELRLDTFADRRRSYYFVSNPLGVQLDAFWPEVGGAYDESFDALWHSRGQRTEWGFVVSMSIPFASLRFRPAAEQTWGIYVARWIPRTGEWVFWPQVSNREQSFLSQMATLQGIGQVSTGRGMQIIPYVTSRSFRAIDRRDGSQPRFRRETLEARLGADAKLVFRESFVLDATANPDFSQVESDAPQITTNQRFELFFPEKRPFFLENASNFQTPITLLFTRRVAEPHVGAKVTGKAGPWAVGTFFADDQAPGASRPDGDRLHGRSAWAGAVRVNRDVFGQSTVGAIATHRTFAGRHNWVAGLDTRLRLSRTWLLDAQSVLSRAAMPEAARQTGHAHLLVASREGRSFVSQTEVNARSADFVTDLGFVPRVDAREAKQTLEYAWRPAKAISSFGPTLTVNRLWSSSGTPLDWSLRPGFGLSLVRSTSLRVFAEPASVGLNPQDVRGLAEFRRYRTLLWGASGASQPSPALSFSASVTRGTAVNFAPAALHEPELGHALNGSVRVGIRPTSALRIDNTWLRWSLAPLNERGRILTADILRTQWMWQFTREWAVRFIGQCDRTSVDPTRTSTLAIRHVNADVLLWYMVNPWSGLYVGYNGNLQNEELVLTDAQSVLRRGGPLRLDAWQVFVKWSYLIRF